MSVSDPADGVSSLVRRSLEVSWHADGAISLPTVMIEKPTSSTSWALPGEYTAADKALDYYRSVGLLGERTRKNQWGYPGLLRDLAHCPPWVHNEPDREREQRALIDHIHDRNDDELLDDLRRDYSRHSAIFPRLSMQVPNEHRDMREVSFREKLSLGRAMGVDTFYKNYNAVFDFDEFTPAAGAPDLLLWSPPYSKPFWCFTEVKAPGDNLRASQTNWLREHIDIIRGHYFLTILLA